MNAAAAYVLASLTCMALISGQILFKKVAIAIQHQPLSEAVRNQEALVYFVLAGIIYGAATITWVLALRQIPLSRAYMLMAAGFVLVPIFSHFLFGEPLSGKFLIGAAMIAAGVALTNSG